MGTLATPDIDQYVRTDVYDFGLHHVVWFGRA
jgi:hypothetical protein